MNPNSEIVSALRALGIATMAVAVSSCSGSSNGSQAQKRVQSQGANAPAWVISLKSACDGVTDNTCRGQYGFSVDANGAYKVGPAPGGQVLTGQLGNDKLAELTKKVDGFGNLATAQTTQETCISTEDSDSGEAIPGADDTLTLTQQTTQHVLLLAKEGQSCTEIANTTAVEDLHKAMTALESTYYPDIFPDACTDAVALLQQQYAAVQTCSTDKDCAYYNLNLGENSPTFDPATDGVVFTDSIYGYCSMVKPIVVANSALLTANADALSKLIDSTIDACQDRQPSDCTATTIDASQAPTCVQNVCRVASSPSPAASVLRMR